MYRPTPIITVSIPYLMWLSQKSDKCMPLEMLSLRVIVFDLYLNEMVYKSV